jgi:hypothetical protein
MIMSLHTVLQLMEVPGSIGAIIRQYIASRNYRRKCNFSTLGLCAFKRGFKSVGLLSCMCKVVFYIEVTYICSIIKLKFPDQRNQLYKISCRSVKGFLFGDPPKIACSHRKAKSSLT